MLKRVHPNGLGKHICFVIFFFLIHFFIYSQTVILTGIVKDVLTLKLIQDANIKVYGTTKGTSTDKAGKFSLRLTKIPVYLVITCVAYEDAYEEIKAVPENTKEILLSPKSYTLREVDISSEKYSYLFKKKDYSVLDYELTGDNILLVIFRYQLKRSETILLNRSGDILAVSKLPEGPPSSLFKDFLGNVHYFSKADHAYQCFFNENMHSIEFLYKTTVDSLQSLVRQFIFKMSDRLYFQESMANGFGTAIGFYEKGTGKKYIRRYSNEKKLSEYRDDQIFYAKWNCFITNSDNIPLENISIDSRFYNDFEARAHQFEFFNLIFPVIKTGENSIAVFNFAGDIIELMNEDGRIIRTVPITFHKESVQMNEPSNAGWRWESKILVDDYDHDVYTLYHRNGMVKVLKIDLETGKLNKGTILPFPFPEKIEIHKGEAYFLIMNDIANDKWELVKCKI